MSDELNFIYPTHVPILASYDYPFLSYGRLNMITLPSHGTVTAHAPCHVTYHRGGGMIHIFEIPEPNLSIHFVTFGALRRSVSHAIGQKRVFPLRRLQSLLRMRSITWPVHRGSPKPQVTIFWPRIAYSLSNFYGATMTIKGSLYWSIPMLKQFSVAKKLSPVKIGPQNGGFSEI